MGDNERAQGAGDRVKLSFSEVNDGWLDGWRDSRHEKVGRNEAPGEPRPPGRPSLIEGYALKILDVTIPPCAFALEEIA